MNRAALAGYGDFLPPPAARTPQAFALALFAHLALVLALAWGVNWQRELPNTLVQAELWAVQPQAAAAPPAPPPPAPVPESVAAPVVSPPAPPPLPAAQIATEPEPKAKSPVKEAPAPVATPPSRAEVAAKKREQQREAQRQREVERERARENEIERYRDENLNRAALLAKNAGADPASQGPSDAYAARVRARVYPNIVFSDEVSGNPRTEVLIHVAPDGTITDNVRVTKPSGNKAWDEAVLKAIRRTQSLPRDSDGRIHSPLTLVFSPQR